MEAKFTTFAFEAGLDEAGRGCLAGPVTAAAVILPEKFDLPGLNDSKKLNATQRKKLRMLIEEQALAYSVVHVDHETVDKLNVLQASIHAMHLCVEKLHITPEYLLIDGNKFKPYKDIPYSCMVKGDGRFLNIAAASVLAKTYRDDFMKAIATEFPAYGWTKNKGYPTQEHRDAIAQFGPCLYHRKSFTLLPRQTKLEL